MADLMALTMTLPGDWTASLGTVETTSVCLYRWDNPSDARLFVVFRHGLVLCLGTHWPDGAESCSGEFTTMPPVIAMIRAGAAAATTTDARHAARLDDTI